MFHTSGQITPVMYAFLSRASAYADKAGVNPTEGVCDAAVLGCVVAKKS